MSTIVMDTLEFATKLKAGGFTEQQAETQARAFADVVEKQLATKRDMDDHEQNLRRDIESLRADVKRDIELLRAEVKKDLAETKAELIRWVVGVGVLQTTLVVAIIARLAKSFNDARHDPPFLRSRRQ
jgi:hypothetical protein